jgi:hypothetical protein
MSKPSLRPGRRARRLLTTATALLVTGAGLALTATSASAWSFPSVCAGNSEKNVCLEGYTPGNHMVQVHVGIDVYMSRQDAEAILAQPGSAFSAAMIGDDPSYDNYLTYVDLTWEVAWDGGISAEFDRLIPASLLNEDNSWFDNRDEVYARVSLYDARSGTIRVFNTPDWSFYAESQ